MNRNPILMTDAYKHSHFLQYPPGTNYVYEYIEARAPHSLKNGKSIKSLTVVGQRYLLRTLNDMRVTKNHVARAKRIVEQGGCPFNEDGWNLLVDRYGGDVLGPLRIHTVEEGSVVDIGTPIVVVFNVDPDFFWLPGFLETVIQRCIWYPTTVASISGYCHDMIKGYMEKTCDNLDKLPFMLHDFGARGVSSSESAGIGGFAHLTVGFKGSDTLEAVDFAEDVYSSTDDVAYFIPAAEHSTITSWGRENEAEAYRNMIKQFGQGALYAVVSDSYDIFNACGNIWGEELKAEVLAAPGTLVIRPDSGDPCSTVLRCLNILGNKFGTELNSKGFMLLNKVRLIQGDGVNPVSIEEILFTMRLNGWSADNIAFGMGGALLQKLDRDTFSFAMKCSAINNTGDLTTGWREFKKSPIGQTSKTSKAGLVYSAYSDNGKIETIIREDLSCLPERSAMTSLANAYTNDLATIRDRRERSEKSRINSMS